MITKCLFPAAGFGTRFLPATKSMPKEMLPIVNKPLIQYGVEEALSANIKHMAIVIGRNKYSIEDHFDISYELEHKISGTSKEHYLNSTRNLIEQCTFSYVRQNYAKGLGHAVLTGKPLIGDEPFAVVLADDLCINLHGDSVLSQMLAIYQQYKCSVVAVEEVAKEHISSYGVISGEQIANNVYRVNSMVEKPSAELAPSNLAAIGRYILTPDIFSILQNTKAGVGGEIQLTDALIEQAKNGKLIAYKFTGTRFDCGSFTGFIAATNFCFAKLYNQN